MKLRLATATFLVLPLLTACPGTLDDIERFRDAAALTDSGAATEPPACPDVETTLFPARCGTAGCHAAAEPTAGLDLASPDVRARLTGKPVTGGSSGALLIDPAHPESSALYTKLTANPPFGSRMPLGGPLDDRTIACVLAWIEEAPASPTSSTDAGPPPDASATPDAATTD